MDYFHSQELGASNSSYSLKDQHRLNIEFHIPDHEFTLDDVEALVKKMKYEWKVGKGAGQVNVWQKGYLNFPI